MNKIKNVWNSLTKKEKITAAALAVIAVVLIMVVLF